MSNELLLIVSLVVIYSMLILWFKLFGKNGVICFSVLATVLANIEVLILVDGFGIEMTLGNILFASTFLATDILSEMYGQKTALKAANICIAASVTMIIVTQSWLLYTPSANDISFDSIKSLFSGTPRVILASLIVYAIVQKLDVLLFHGIKNFTKKLCSDERRFLWLRNNGATLISQLINSILYTLGAFLGTYPSETIISIIISSFAIFIVTSLADTPFLYLARYIYAKDSARKKSIMSEE